MNCIDVGSGAQFFLDERFVAESEGVRLEMNPPRKAGPVLEPERPWEAYRIDPTAVIEDDGVYRMWYTAIACYEGTDGTLSCPRCEHENSGRKVLCTRCGWPLLDIDLFQKELYHKCYAVSHDGVRWERPELGLVEFRGSRRNNIIPFIGPVCVPAIDPLGPPCRKFMAISRLGLKMYLSVSPDGIHWTMKPEVVLPFEADTNNQVIYDPVLGKYVAFLRGFPGRRTVVRCEFESLDEAPWPFVDRGREPDRTGVIYITNELETVMDIDEDDPPLPGLDINNLSAHLYAPGVYLGFIGLFRHYPGGLDRRGREGHRYFAHGNDGVFETQLAVSRDGRKWLRPDRRSYLSPGLFGGPEGGWLQVGVGMVRRGDELYQYYVNQRPTHGILDLGSDKAVGSIYRAVQVRDRFICLSTDSNGGRFMTPLIRHRGRQLELNINCQGLGEAFVAILDEHGRPIEGFAREDCDPVDLNQLCHIVTWRGNRDVGALAGRPIRLELSMRSARLYTFRFAS